VPVLQGNVSFAAYIQQAREFVHRATASEETMTLQSVKEQYVKHFMRLMKKNATNKRNKGLAYYNAAADAVQTLIDQPTVVVPDRGLKFHRL
jgi:5-methylcytosine-specific restriction endonuclease McrBC regulatory subunit McrC